jgi:hypothetical protein
LRLVFKVKSLKTYNLDQDVIIILSRKRNKSAFVAKAIRRMQHEIDYADTDLIHTRQLLIKLKHRDISEALKALIQIELESTSVI